MTNLLKQLKYELLLFIRQPIYVLLILIAPAIMLMTFGSMYGNQTYDGINFFEKYLPAYIFSLSLSIVMFSVALEGVEKREQGIMKMLKTKPYKYSNYVLAQIIKAIIVSTFGFAELLLVSIIVYKVDLSNVNLLYNYGVYIIILIINAYIFISLYSIFTSFKVALLISLILYQLVMFLSDFTIPVSSLPDIAQKIAKINPLYHLNHVFISSWNNNIFSDFTTSSLVSIVAIIIIASIVSLVSSRVQEE